MAVLDHLIALIGNVNANGTIVPALVTAVGTTTGASAGFNVIDLNPSLGAANGGELAGALDVLVQVLQTLTSAGAATIQFQLVQADDANLTTNVQVLTQTDAFPFGLLVAGTREALNWARAAPYVPRRFAGVRIIIAGAPLTNATGQFYAVVGEGFHDSPARLFRTGFAIA